MKRFVQLAGLIFVFGLGACGDDGSSGNTPAPAMSESMDTTDTMDTMVGSGWDIMSVERADGVVYMDQIYPK